jgi:predicted ATPase
LLRALQLVQNGSLLPVGYHFVGWIDPGSRTCRCTREGGAAVVLELPRDAPADQELARLQAEHALLRELDVPGIVRPLDLAGEEGAVALVFDDPGGQTLSDLLANGPLDLESALAIAVSIAETLALLHRSRVVHRNIHPDSVLVTAAKNTCLAGLGAAARLPLPLPSSDQRAALEGALAYVSPEQTGRTSEPVDERSDLYSLGATLYEALTGAPPFTATEPLELIHCHLARKPEPVSAVMPEIPEVVSDIVLMLLAKSPADRYQSARGLEADLRECLRQWQKAGKIDAFALARHDVPRELRILPKLYGRARELEALALCLERARWGAAELAIVSGSSGVGKSALVEALRPLIAKSGARLSAGKFDQISRGVPYAPIAEAFRDQVRAALAEPAAALDVWKEKFHQALGKNGKLIADLVPEVELLIGPQPPAPVLGAGASQNRFAVVFQSFLRLFCEPGQPLVLFLDDLQWADLASLKLIELSLSAESAKNILVIGCCPSNNPGAQRVFDIVVEPLRKSRVKVSSIEVEPLATGHVAELLADTLRRSLDDVGPLAALVHDKTEGNPFFLVQFLKSLHEEGLLVIDPVSGAYDWDLDGARRAAATSNVVELLAARIQGLDESAQRVLRLAACFGHSFRLPALSTIAELSVEETRAALRPAIAEGLLVASAAEPDRYRFSHDRVQQTAYHLIDEVRRQAVHLRIGRLMQSGAAFGALEDQVFDVAEHLNRGAQLITEPDERLRLARLNLEAGNRARNATAYDSAERCFAGGIAALPPGSWELEHELTFCLHLARAECQWLLGHHDAAHAILDELDAHATSRLHRVKSRCLRATVLEAELRIDDAVRASLDVLPLFGIELPAIDQPWAQAVDDSLADVQRLLAGRSPDKLADLPALTDPEIQSLQKLVMIAAPLTYPFGADVFRVLNLLQMKLVLSHGLSDVSAYAFVLYGIVLAERRGLYEEAHAFGTFALSLCERSVNAQIACKVNQGFGSFLVHHHRPLHESRAFLDRACALGLSSGELTHMAHATVGMGINRMGHGDELVALLADVERYIGLTERAKNTLSRTIAETLRRAIRCLLGKTLSRDTWSQDGFDEDAFVRSLEERGVPMLTCWYYSLKQAIAIFYEEHGAALAFGNEAERYAGGMSGLYSTTDLVFYGCLSRLAVRAEAKRADLSHLDAEIALRRSQMAIWAEHCPANFRHKLLLIDAERARQSGRTDAIRLYLQASRAAHEQRFPHHEALALERLATLHLEQEDQTSAHHHMQSAREAYVRWGARVKVAQLDARYPGLAEGWDEGPRPCPPGAGDRSPCPASPARAWTPPPCSRRSACSPRSSSSIACWSARSRSSSRTRARSEALCSSLAATIWCSWPEAPSTRPSTPGCPHYRWTITPPMSAPPR